MTLNLRIADIEKNMKEKEMKCVVNFSKPSFFKKQETLQILVLNVSDEITASADVQRILRKVVGYGTVKMDYDENDKSLLVNYTPLKKGETSTTEFRVLPYVPVSTPGSTEYNK